MNYRNLSLFTFTILLIYSISFSAFAKEDEEKKKLLTKEWRLQHFDSDEIKSKPKSDQSKLLKSMRSNWYIILNSDNSYTSMQDKEGKGNWKLNEDASALELNQNGKVNRWEIKSLTSSKLVLYHKNKSGKEATLTFAAYKTKKKENHKNSKT